MGRTTRRTVLRRSAATLGAAALGYTDATDLPRRRSMFVAAEDEQPLSVAMLDAHALQMEPLLEALSDSLGFNVEVTMLAYGELYSQLSLALTQRAATFDVVSLDDAWIPQFASFLSPLSQSQKYLSQVPAIVSALSRFPEEAAPCGLPWLGNVQFFVSRPDWLADLGLQQPETWDEATATASAVTYSIGEDEELAGFAIETLSLHQILDSFLPILRGYGKELIDPETTVPQLDTPEALAAVTVFQELAVMSPEESAATGEPSNTDRFESGTVAMMANFWATGVLASSTVEQVRSSGPIACEMQPAQGGIARHSMTGVWLLGIPSGCLQPDRARDFIEWLISPQTQRSLIDVQLPPAFAPAFADDAMIDVQPLLPQLLDLLASSTPRPRSPYYPQLELLLARELNEMLAGDQTGEEALRNANLAMREFLAREGVLDA